MKRTLLYICVFFVTTCVVAQSTHVKKYYHWINQAELAICDSDFAKANKCYEKAFSYHKPLGVHLSTAYSMNACFTCDTSRIYDYAVQLLQCGDGGLAERYAKSSTYDTNIYNRLLILEDIVSPTFDTVLHSRFEEILDKDQSYRHSWGDNPGEDSLNRAIIREIHSLYEKYELINDYTAGFLFAIYYLSTPGLHYVNSNIHDLQDLFKKEVVKGNIPADLYMKLEDTYLMESRIYS